MDTQSIADFRVWIEMSLDDSLRLANQITQDTETILLSVNKLDIQLSVHLLVAPSTSMTDMQ